MAKNRASAPSILALTLAGSLPWALGVVALPACTAPRGGSADEASRKVAEEEHLRRATEDRLRALFPEVQGAITRAAIAQALIQQGDAEIPLDDRSTAAIAAIRRGEFDRARGVLGEIQAQTEIEKARAYLAENDHAGALAALERALSIAPDSTELRAMRADSALVVARATGDTELVRSALADYLSAAAHHGGARAWLGASRAAGALGDGDKALEYARQGVAQLDGPEMPSGVAEAPEKTLAVVSLAAYTRSNQGPNDEATLGYWRESKSAFEMLLGRTPDDVTAWSALADLHAQRGQHEAARNVAARALRFFPSDAGLHAAFARATNEVGGRAALLASYDAFLAKHPKVAIAHWYPAEARFQAALDAWTEKRASGDAFAESEAGFARCRELEPAYEERCREYEALCRTGRGWTQLSSGDLDGARRAFLSVEDVKKGALKAEISGRLRSAMEGLHAVGSAYQARSVANASTSIDDLERATRIYDYLHEYEPENVVWANNAGFFGRDAAVAIEIGARALASQGKIDEANRQLAHARELMEQSYVAYSSAAKLAPDDVRIANDTALILVYYLQRDVDTAERLLKHAQQLGEEQVAKLRASASEAGISAEERDARQRTLEEVDSALGDAYQNLGVLELTLKGDAAAAKTWLDKCLVTGPDPREEVRGKGGYLDQCKIALETKSDTRVQDATRWAAPVKARTAQGTAQK